MVLDCATNPTSQSENPWLQNFWMPSGDNRTLVIPVSQPREFDDEGNPLPVDAEEELIPVDLTGAVLTWQLKKKLTDVLPLIEKTLSGGGIVVDSEDSSICRVFILAADTEDLDGRYFHELQVIDMFGQTSTPMRGRVVIEADVVR